MHAPIARRRLLAGLLAPALPFFAQANAVSDYPVKPVRWIVPTSTGAGTDYAARSFAQIASEAWKQSVVVDNRSGASGMLGLDAVASAPADGYTLSFMSISQFIDATLLQKFSFETNKDFTPISLLASTPLILVAHADVNVSTVAQLLAKARSQPRVLNYSSGGSGGLTHLAMEVFLNRAGIEMVHVPYKGSGPAIADLIAGHVQLSFSTPPAVLQHIKTGKLKALAVTSQARSPLAPEVPTFAELGYPTVGITTWYGLFGPANLPPELTEKISNTITTTAKVAATRARLSANGIEPILSTPAEFGRHLRRERDQILAIVKNIGFKKD